MTPKSPTVVGIGASAGGLSALKIFLDHFPSDSGLVFVIVVHLSPDHESHLAELLQPYVKFPIQQVASTVPLVQNNVYVIPPNANLSAIDTHLRLSRLEEQRKERAPIDHFFCTLASTHDGNGIAVILTGTGSDGTLGIRDIKAKGGLVIVQDPNEAEFDGMPQSAIATGLVDLILPIADIPDHIMRYNRTEPHLEVPEEDGDVSGGERMLLQKIFAQLRARTDRDFTRYKRSTILRRIARRMQLNYLEDLSKYLEVLRERPEEVRALADDLLITVTHFFRDPEVFEKLKAEEFPRLFSKKGRQESIRVWSVGCATGEEAYSLAILLAEEAAQHDNLPRIQIFASDVHSRSLERARDGFYPGDVATDIGPERLRRYFDEENGGYRIAKEIRDMVVFAPHNLLADPPFSRMDVISCRNLLIYLEREVQHDVIELFHYALNPEGTLLLGSAESMDAPELFRAEDKRLCFFRKRDVPSREPRLPVFPLSALRRSGNLSVTGRRLPAPIPVGELHQEMVERYAPPSILIGPDHKVVHLSEHAGRFLIHPGGEPTQSVIPLVREELRIELQAALHGSREGKRAHDSRPIMVRFEGQPGWVIMHVRPALPASREGYVLVIFEERESQPAAESEEPGATSDQRHRELEAELAEARQRLQTIIEEFESSQEEMKAASEEMQSTNEELRSTMEELETSKEELQSINEELQTVNQQNRHKVEELSQLSGDLQNLLSATDIATLFLDRELRIMRFTPKLSELFNVRPADRGRPISDLTHRLGYDNLREDAAAVLGRLVPIEREIQDDRNFWYLTRILPYRSTQDRIEGVVITFIDIDKRKRAEDALREREERLRRMVNVEVVGVLITDESGLITECNTAGEKMLGYSRDEIRSAKLTWLDITPPEQVALARKQMEELATSGRSELTEEKEYIRKDGQRSWMMFTAANLGDGSCVRYCFDVADRKRAEHLVAEAERGLSVANHALVHAYSDLKQFSYAVSHDMQEPLRMVTSYAQLLAREFRGKLDPRADEYIDFAVKGALQMEALLTDLREYWSVDEARIEKLIPVDCNQALRRALDYLETAVRESGAKITAEHLPTVRAEEYPMTLLFQNLLGNAVKYRRPHTPPDIRVSVVRSGEFWQFSITDNGMGIDADSVERVFEPFKRLHGSKYPGTGLGLAMCRKVVARYTGKIWIVSQEGHGSTVRFTVPAGG